MAEYTVDDDSLSIKTCFICGYNTDDPEELFCPTCGVRVKNPEERTYDEEDQC